jgi:hypothetical protein
MPASAPGKPTAIMQSPEQDRRHEERGQAELAGEHVPELGRDQPDSLKGHSRVEATQRALGDLPLDPLEVSCIFSFSSHAKTSTYPLRHAPPLQRLEKLARRHDDIIRTCDDPQKTHPAGHRGTRLDGPQGMFLLVPWRTLGIRPRRAPRRRTGRPSRRAAGWSPERGARPLARRRP